MTFRLGLLMVAVLATTIRAADPCANYLAEMGATPAERDGYKRRQPVGAEQLRCEGMYDVKTSGTAPEIAVVSFTDGALTYRLTKELVLDVRAAALPRTAQSIRIRALPKKEGKNYQMDAVARPTDALIWPAGTFLEKQGLDAPELGVYGVVEDKKRGPVFVPLSALPVGQARPAAPQPLLLAVRYPYTMASIKWRVGRTDASGVCVSNEGYERVEAQVGGTPFDLNLRGRKGDCVVFRLKRDSRSTAQQATLQVALPGTP